MWKELRQGHDFYLGGARVSKPFSLLLLPFLARPLTLSLSNILFLFFAFSLSKLSLFFSLSLSPRFFSQNFGKEK